MFCVLINFVLKLETYQNADGEGKVDGDGYVLCARIKIIGIFGSDALNSIKYHVNHVNHVNLKRQHLNLQKAST